MMTYFSCDSKKRLRPLPQMTFLHSPLCTDDPVWICLSMAVSDSFGKGNLCIWSLSLPCAVGGLALVKQSNIVAPHFPSMSKKTWGENMVKPCRFQTKREFTWNALQIAKSSPLVLCKGIWSASKGLVLDCSSLILYDCVASFQTLYNWKSTIINLAFIIICAYYATHKYMCAYMCIYVHTYSIYTIYIYSLSKFCTVTYFTLYSVQDVFMTNGNSIFHLTLFFTPM